MLGVGPACKWDQCLAEIERVEIRHTVTTRNPRWNGAIAPSPPICRCEARWWTRRSTCWRIWSETKRPCVQLGTQGEEGGLKALCVQKNKETDVGSSLGKVGEKSQCKWFEVLRFIKRKKKKKLAQIITGRENRDNILRSWMATCGEEHVRHISFSSIASDESFPVSEFWVAPDVRRRRPGYSICTGKPGRSFSPRLMSNFLWGCTQLTNMGTMLRVWPPRPRHLCLHVFIPHSSSRRVTSVVRFGTRWPRLAKCTASEILFVGGGRWWEAACSCYCCFQIQRLKTYHKPQKRSPCATKRSKSSNVVKDSWMNAKSRDSFFSCC